MRYEFGKVIVELAEKDPKIVVLVGDIGVNVFDSYRAKKLPFYNLGLAEQSIIGVASGMALEGLKPWVYTITPFLVERPFEQIKLDIDQQKVNVKLVGYADYPTQGPTHAEVLTPQAITKAGLFPNIRCYSPRDSKETREIIMDEYHRKGPAYISLKKDRS